MLVAAALVPAIASADAPAPAKRKLSLPWTPIPGAQQYEVEIARSAQFHPTVYRGKVKAAELQVQIPPGIYFFRVRGIDSEALPGPWSDIEGFSVNPRPPEAVFPPNGAKYAQFIPEDKGIQLTWKAGIEGTQYDVEVQDARGGTQRFTAQSPQLLWRPGASGSFNWRVGFHSVGGAEWGAWQKVQVEPTAVTRPPDIKALAVANVPIIDGVLPSPEVMAEAGRKSADVREDPNLMATRNSEVSLLARGAISIVSYGYDNKNTNTTSTKTTIITLFSTKLQ